MTAGSGRHVRAGGVRATAAVPLAQPVGRFFRRYVVTRRRQLATLGAAWQALLPAELVEHSCLEGFSRGQLKVLVDSASHLAELDALLREGLVEELRQQCPRVSLAGVKLSRGCWYRTDEDGTRVPQYPQEARRSRAATPKRAQRGEVL